MMMSVLVGPADALFVNARLYRRLLIISTCAYFFIRQKQPPVLTFFQPKTTRAYILMTAQMAFSVTAKKGGYTTIFSMAVAKGMITWARRAGHGAPLGTARRRLSTTACTDPDLGNQDRVVHGVEDAADLRRRRSMRDRHKV